jgi:hypothetical protein
MTFAVGMLVSFGVLPAVDQDAVLSAASAATAGVFAVAAACHMLVGLIVHSRVTPVTDPRNNAGQPLVPAPTVTAVTLVTPPSSGDGPLPNPLNLPA